MNGVVYAFVGAHLRQQLIWDNELEGEGIFATSFKNSWGRIVGIFDRLSKLQKHVLGAGSTRAGGPFDCSS